MKKYTQEEFNGFEIVDGRRICPSGDYSLITSFGGECSFGDDCRFGERCRFGEKCSFGKRCSFGGWCRFGGWCKFGEECSFEEECSFGEKRSFENKGFGNKILQIRAGSVGRTSTAYYLDTGIYIRSGCFFGTLEEFEAQVEQTHGDNIHGKTYKLWCEIIRINK